MLLVALVFLAAGVLAISGSPKRLGREIVHAIVCAARGGCPDPLADAYGEELAGQVAHYAPNVVYEHGSVELPVDFRRCRRTSCSNAPTEAVSTTESSEGYPVTAYTHVVDERPRGGALYLQYWLYFPESFSGGIGRQLGPFAHKWPGFHRDDWEGYQVRIQSRHVVARATAHGGYRSFKHSGGWGPWTGWYRVSGGSHAGHLVQHPDHERTTAASDIELVPIETLSETDRYSFRVSPPWQKPVYLKPDLASS
jgi:hypothetical protein